MCGNCGFRGRKLTRRTGIVNSKETASFYEILGKSYQVCDPKFLEDCNKRRAKIDADNRK